MSRLKSSAGALWVSQPTLITSTPVRAISATFSGVIPPLASVRTRPSTIRTASASCGRRHVVEQYRVDRCLERFSKLFESLDFDFDLDHVSDVSARGGDGVVDEPASAR